MATLRLPDVCLWGGNLNHDLVETTNAYWYLNSVTSIVCICTCVFIYMHVCAHACRGQKTTNFGCHSPGIYISFLLLLLLFWVSSWSKVCYVSQAGYPGIHLSPPSQSIILINLSLHVCKAGTLPTKLFPQPSPRIVTFRTVLCNISGYTALFNSRYLWVRQSYWIQYPQMSKVMISANELLDAGKAGFAPDYFLYKSSPCATVPTTFCMSMLGLSIARRYHIQSVTFPTYNKNERSIDPHTYVFFRSGKIPKDWGSRRFWKKRVC